MYQINQILIWILKQNTSQNPGTFCYETVSQINQILTLSLCINTGLIQNTFCFSALLR